MRKRSITRRAQISVIGLFLLPIVLAFVSIIFAILSRGLYPREINIRGTRHMATHVAETIDQPNFAGGLLPFCSEVGVDCTVVSLDGKVLARTDRELPVPPPDRLATINRDLQVLSHLSWPPLISMGVYQGAVKRAVLILQMRGEMIVNPLPVRPVLILALGAVLSLTLVIHLARRVTRPLEKLSAAAAAFGHGDMSARSGIGGNDEVGELAQTFDAMADRITAQRFTEKQMLASVSHELKTPLARLRMALALVDRGDPKVARRMSVVEQELGELEHLVSDLLLAARLELSGVPLKPGPIPVGELIERSRERLLALAPEREVSVAIDDAVTVWGDASLLARVLDNLLDNSRRYSTPGTAIVVKAHGENDLVRLTVDDEGPGISPEDRARIFEPFFRGATAADHEGSGLGLCLARQIVEAHGGQLSLGASSRGTCVEIVLPACRPTQNVA